MMKDYTLLNLDQLYAVRDVLWRDEIEAAEMAETHENLIVLFSEPDSWENASVEISHYDTAQEYRATEKRLHEERMVVLNIIKNRDEVRE